MRCDGMLNIQLSGIIPGDYYLIVLATMSERNAERRDKSWGPDILVLGKVLAAARVGC